MKNLNDLYEKIGNIAGTQKMILDEMRIGFNRINGTTKNHDKRINHLENDVSNIKGKAAILGAGAGIGIALLWEIIKNKFRGI